MPITKELLDQIAEYEGQGYTPDEIVQGMASSPKYADISGQMQEHAKSGYTPIEILEGIKTSPIVAPAAPATPSETIPESMSYPGDALSPELAPAPVGPSPLAILGRGAKQIPESMARTGANIVRGVGEVERALTPAGVPNVIADTAIKYGKEASDAYSAVLREREQRDTAGLGRFEKLLYQTPASIAANVPSIAAGVATGGVAPALTVMGAGKLADRFSEFIDSGKGIPVSMVAAGASTAAEVVPEVLPLGWLLNKGTPAVKAVLQYVVGEQAQEQITTLSDNLIDWAVKNPAMTLKDWWEKVQKPAMVDTAVSTAIQAPAVGAIARGGMRLADRFQRKAEEAGPGPAPAPPGGAPPVAGDSTIPPGATPVTPPITPTEPSESPPAAPTPVDVLIKRRLEENAKDPEPASEGYIRRQAERDAWDHGMPLFHAPKISGDDYQQAVWDWSRQSGTDVSRADMDIGHLGGMNEDPRVGHAKANAHLKAISEIIHKTFSEMLPNEKLTFSRYGGDELAVDAIGVPQEDLDKAAIETKIRVDQYAKDNGLTQLKSKKGIADVTLHFNTASRAAFDTFEEFRLYNDAKRTKEKINVSGIPAQEAQVVPFVRQAAGAEQSAGRDTATERPEAPAGAETIAQKPAKAAPVGPAVLPEVRTAAQSIGPDRIARLSESQWDWLDGLRSAINGAEAKIFVSAKAMREDMPGYWAGDGFDHIRKAFDLPSDFSFKKSGRNRTTGAWEEGQDLRALRKALEGKTLGKGEADRIDTFLRAHFDVTMRESDIIAGEPARRQAEEEEVPFDLFTGEPEAPKKKKAKPVQQGLPMGQVKGEDLKAPEKKGKGVDIGETELGKAAKEAKDRQSQEKLFDIAGEYSEREATRTRAAFETPEIVRLIKKLTGKYPKVAPGQIKTAMGIALGFYKPSSRSITVSEKSAEVEELVKRVLAHEFGHRVHHIGDPETMKRGNILGIIAAFRKYAKKTLPEYQGAPDEVLSRQDRARLRAEAEKEARQFIKAEKAAVEAEDDLLAGNRKVSVDEIKAIWNDVAAKDKDPDLYDYISRLTAAQKKSVLVEAMRGISNVEIQRQVREKKYSDLDEKAKEILKQKIKEEIEKRKLYDSEVITEELKQVVRMIKPFNENDPKMVKYRFSATELYADGVSMAIIDPDFLKATAPNFYKAFHSWMGARPEFKAEYDRIMGMLEGDREALLQEYQDEINKGYDAHEQAIKRQVEQAKIGSLHDVYSHLVDSASAYWKLINKKEKEGVVIQPEKDPRYWLTEIPYSNSEVYAFLKESFDQAGTRLEKAGISNEVVGNYFQHMRVINERSTILDEQGNPYTDKANPQGHTKKSSQEQIDKIERDLGPEKFAVLQKAYEDIQKIWQENVIAPIRESGMWSDKLLKYAEANKYYAKFRTVENFSEQLDEHFGGGSSGSEITGHVFMRHGSFQDIANPYIQTMLTGAQLIRAAHKNQAKKFSVEFLLRNYGSNEITRARQEWNGKFRQTKIVNNERVGTVIYLEGGKPQAFYVKREIADIINAHSEQAGRVVSMMQAAVAPVKAAQVKYNVLWAMRNVVRDFLGSFKKAGEIKDPVSLAYWYLRALPHAIRDVSGRPLNDTLRFLYKNKFLAPDRLYGTVDREEVDELENMLASFGLSDVQHRNKVLKPLIKTFAVIQGITKFSERISKVAGGLKGMQLVEEGKRTKKEAAYSVREFWGTPNVLRRGIWGKAINAGLVYSNVNVQDIRSHIEAAKKNRFIYAYKTMLMNVLPAVVTAGLSAGWFRSYMDDDEDEEMKEWYRKNSNYQKDRYLNIPLGFDSKGKAVGLKMPMDFFGTAVYGTVLAGLEGRYGNNGMFRTMWEQNPYLSPMLVDFGSDMVDYARGREIYDDFRGRPAIDTDVQKAGGARKAKEIAKYEWNKLGGSTIHRFQTDDPSRIKSDLEENLQEYPGKLASAFMFVSDYGVKESARETQEDIEKTKASKRLDIKDAIKEDIKAQGGRPSDEAPYDLWSRLVDEGKLDPVERKPRQFAATYDRYMRGGMDDARLESMARADVDGRIALMERYRKELSEAKFDALEKQALAEGLLKRSFWRKQALRPESQ